LSAASFRRWALHPAHGGDIVCVARRHDQAALAHALHRLRARAGLQLANCRSRGSTIVQPNGTDAWRVGMVNWSPRL
jgi:hypothetical protein